MHKIQTYFNDLYPYIISGIVAAGIALRIAGLTTAGIWYDESLPFEAARLPFFSMLAATKYTFAPPLWGAIVWISVRVFGQNEFALRLPALLASIATFWLVYKLSVEFKFTEAQKVLVMFFVALLPYQLWIAQDGRAYSLMAAFYLGAAWFALHNRWIGFTACAGLLLYTHYAALFYLVGIYAAALLGQKFELSHIKKLFASGVIILLCFSFWVPVYLETLKIDFTVEPISVTELLGMFYRLLFADTLSHSRNLEIIAVYLVAISLALAIVFSFLTFFRWINQNSATQPQVTTPSEHVYFWQIITLALLPLIAMIAWSLLWKNFIYYRLLAALMIPLVMWMIYVLTKSPIAQEIASFFLPIWIFLLITSLGSWSPVSKSGDMHSIINMVNSQWEEGDVIYHITGTSYLPFSQYLRDKPEYLMNTNLHAWLLPMELKDIFGIKQASLESLQSTKRVWVFFSRDPLIDRNSYQRAKTYVNSGTLVGTVKAWQFSTIEVYLVPMTISP